MPPKGAAYIGLVAAGAVVGAASTSLFRNHEYLNAPEAETLGASPIVGHGEEVELLRAQYARQIEQLRGENEELQTRLSDAYGPARSLTPDAHGARTTELIKRMEVDSRKRAVQMLLSAGYSSDQVEWLRGRLDELQKERALDETERRARGLPSDPVKYMASLYDKDIELRYEIGDDEYERYLRALGRSTSVLVKQVLAGSAADSAGLREGDVILDYDGKRLFNMGELDGLAMGTSGKSVRVTVNRGGEILKFVIQGGPIGVRSRSPSIESSFALRP